MSNPVGLGEVYEVTPESETIPAEQEGATSALSCSISRDDRAAYATLQFVAGPNAGTTAHRLLSGELLSEGLFPGHSTVLIQVGAGEVCERAVLLRPHQVAKLVLDFANPTDLRGRVVDEEGAPIGGARVTLDGRATQTGKDGYFTVSYSASGSAALLATFPGFANARLMIDAERSRSTSRMPILTLRPACQLELRLSGELGASQRARVLLLPKSAPGNGILGSSFPWEQLKAIRMPTRGSALIEGLPPGRLDAIVLSSSGMGTKSFTLERGETRTIVIDMQAVPMLEGSLIANGAPLAAARVVLTSQPFRTAAIALGEARRILYSQPITDLPMARRETTSDAKGCFKLPWWSSGMRGSAPQQLYVLSANGSILYQHEIESRSARLRLEW